ncbi:carboxymuconolactone decarboxylase family protein [Sediminicoccus sp. KRV36]|uniref:carboxymuconolactone decarboxylase family protein n=1 Tax=Sediminicoccus sp. KRV36 TaxID=3133721 RepID=UPI00200FEC3B|nr:carboxymuconolactone decarboxylase family protein [Sediminicoccus rosea]UPY35937.1 carboxymuconolactone decarboxylase family protein [Sediminicoccus rosea]
MPRFTTLTPETMTARQREVAEHIGAGARGGLRGPFPAWLHSPDMADALQRAGRFMRWGSSFPARLSELAILITAKRYRARYEWFAHHPLALEGGLRPEIAEAVRLGQPPADMAADEVAVYRFCTELHADGDVSDAAFEAAKALFGEPGIVELLGICGYYTAVGLTLNVARVPLPEGTPDPFGD